MKASPKTIAAIYARVSSDRQREQGTIDSQVVALQDYAKREHYSVPEGWVFRDEGYSGAVLLRPGLERLRDLSAEGRIAVVLIYSPDRLSRRYAYQVLLVEEFFRHGVEVVFVKSPKATTPEEELLLQFQGMIAEYERAQIVERSRRGKKLRAKMGSVSVLSGAPYGYRYIKKADTCSAYYEVVEEQAEVVRTVFRQYTRDGFSINAISRWLNDHDISTHKGKSRWERSTVWGMLRNPAYKGKACFGKTKSTDRQKITRRLRQRGGFSPRCSSSCERPRQEWIEIPVPAIVSDEAFALVQERLEDNKRFSPRRTVEPTLLQGILVCSICGYALYRTSTRTSKRKLYYYRCIGSDNYRFTKGRVCHNRPIRADYLDDIVWRHVIKLVENPDLIRQEIHRRIMEINNSLPTKQRRQSIVQERTRLQKGVDKLLDAYQAGLVLLEELRVRMPELRKREAALTSELARLESAASDQRSFLRLANDVEGFLTRLRKSANTMDVTDRQKVLRLVVKEILVDSKTIKIRHSVPFSGVKGGAGPLGSSEIPSYLLRSGRRQSAVVQHLSDPI